MGAAFGAARHVQHERRGAMLRQQACQAFGIELGANAHEAAADAIVANL